MEIESVPLYQHNGGNQINFVTTCFLHGVDGGYLEVHGVDGREDVCGPLDHAFARFRHRDRGAPGQEDGFVSWTEGQHAGEPALNQDDLQQKYLFQLLFEWHFS